MTLGIPRGDSRRSSRLIATAGVFLTGCVSYSTQIGREETRGDVQVHVASASGSRRHDEIRVDLVVRSIPNDVRLLGAAITDAKGAPCETGFAARRFGRDKGRTGQDALRPGERLALQFDWDALEVLAKPSPYLELLVQTEQKQQHCIAIPLTAAKRALDWEAAERWSLGVDLSIEGFTNQLGSVSQVITFPLGLGFWIDDYRLDLAAGIAGAGCPESRCAPPSEDQRINYANAFVAHAGVQRSLFERGEVSLGLGLRYRAMYLPADTRDGRETFWGHGPVLAPYVAAVMPVSKENPNIGGAREGFAGLEVPVGYVVADNGEQSLSLGANLRFFFTVF